MELDSGVRPHHQARPKGPIRSSTVRLIVARCEVRYSGRLNAVLPDLQSIPRIVVLRKN